MFRTVRSLVIAAGLFATASTAHAQTLAPAASPVFTVDQIRGAFTNAGYRLDQAHTWDWTAPPVTAFTVHDPANGRVLMVLVYPNDQDAQQARSEAQTWDQQDPTTSGGPHIVPGYGRSVWDGNVALVQSTESQLQQLSEAQQNRDNGVFVDSTLDANPALPNFAVDLDFLQALQSGVVNL